MQRRVCGAILLVAAVLLGLEIFRPRPDTRVVVLAVIAAGLAAIGFAEAPARVSPSSWRVCRRAMRIRRGILDEMRELDPVLMGELRTDEESVAGAVVNDVAYEMALLFERAEAQARADLRMRGR